MKDLAGAYISLGSFICTNRAQTDSAIYYAEKALDICQTEKVFYPGKIGQAYLILSQAFEKKTDTKEALQNYKLANGSKRQPV